MEILSDYIFNEQTVLFIGEYDECGFLCTRVFEEEKMFLVHLSPVDLIDRNLLRLGSTFQGAIKSSKFNLGLKSKCPLQLNKSLDIWVFPTKSYKKPNCAWFCLSHIRKTKPLGVQKTKVILSYGHTFTIEMKESSFNQKRQKTRELREIILKNAKGSLYHFSESKIGFQICEDKGKNRYKIKA